VEGCKIRMLVTKPPTARAMMSASTICHCMDVTNTCVQNWWTGAVLLYFSILHFTFYMLLVSRYCTSTSTRYLV
jgi:hypothetical protein